MFEELQYCNWSFDECLIPSEKWLVARDCGDGIELRRGDSRNWKAYRASLTPQVQAGYPYARLGARCPNCNKEINGVNPYDDGETWRK